jgi:putative PIN family toxin of toxin-antitoxin system
MAKVIIDANVMISAAFGGKPLDAVVLAFRDHEIYLSEEIIRELREVFRKLSRKLSGEQIHFLREKVEQLTSLANCIPVSTMVALSRDAKDDHYLSLCREAEADFLITGDKDLLSLSTEDLKAKGIGCRILSPNSFLEITT